MRIPLAAPVVPLTEAERVRYARTMAVPAIGEVGQQRLRAASVCVVGAGGLGSPVLSYLVGAGVGRLTVIDNDHVEEHNLQRQVLHDMPHVGRPKATSATERLRLLNPDVDLHPVTERLDADSASRLLAGHDIVVDATDNLATRFALDDTCAALGIPLVWGAVQSTVGQVSVFWHAYGPGLRDLLAPDAAPLATIDTVGAFGPMVGMVGSAMAVEVVKLVTGAGAPLLGRVMLLDTLAGTASEVPLRTSRSVLALPEDTL